TFSMLKRHLRTDHNMTPEQYRERWGLPRDYPMVAPNYAKTRSMLAKQIGLGRIRTTPAAEPAGRSGGRKATGRPAAGRRKRAS
ncbi:MAG: MucR family transcriptional regulator, partial [Nevskiales bacterium]